MMFMSVVMVILCIVLGGFMIRSCMGKQTLQAKQNKQYQMLENNR